MELAQRSENSLTVRLILALLWSRRSSAACCNGSARVPFGIGKAVEAVPIIFSQFPAFSNSDHVRSALYTMATDIRTSELKSPIDVAEYLFRRLYEVGVRGVHGVPGDFNLVRYRS